MYKGQTYTVVTDYKPTQKEALKLMAEELDKVKSDSPSHKHLTFLQATDGYITTKENVLSPSTIAGYRRISKAISAKFNALLNSDISMIDVQKEINDYSVGRSPKTVRNAHCFISAVLSMYRPKISLRTSLPQRVKAETYVPTKVTEISLTLENEIRTNIMRVAEGHLDLSRQFE